ncbi:MAG: DUF2793 domain-containing protein [Pseudomonadota bacterium]
MTTETANLALPLVQAAQAQKHVTVNEALARLDVLTQTVVVRQDLSAPPSGAADGEAYVVAGGASAGWAGQDGKLALSLNDGWQFVTPKEGFQAWDAQTGVRLVYAGGAWAALSADTDSAGMRRQSLEFDHTLTAGPSNFTAPVLPAQVGLSAVSWRVMTAVTGSGLTGWSLRVAGVPGDLATGLGTGGSDAGRVLLGSRVQVSTATGFELVGEGGQLSAGSLRLRVFWDEVDLPSSV